ncbi:MAG: phosphatase PAP2 family protein [archaeon]|jgi:undecaprenyl-diphosphatase
MKKMVFEEIMVNQFLQSFSFPLLDLLFKGITYLGHPGPWFFIAAWLFWLGKEKKSFTVASLILFTSFVSGALKMVIARPRPEGILIMGNETSYSMPSGHSTIAGAFSAYAWVSKEIKKNLKYLIITLALFVGVSRIYLGLHYLSDVLVGLLLGAILGLFVFKLETRISKMHFHISKIKDEFFVVAFLVIVVLFDLLVPSEFYGAYALFGYFTGYAILRHVNPILQRAATKKQAIVAIFIGTILLAILGAIAYFSSGLLSQVMFFISGLFVTIIWPIVIAKLTTKRENSKIAKPQNKKPTKKKK